MKKTEEVRNGLGIPVISRVGQLLRNLGNEIRYVGIAIIFGAALIAAGLVVGYALAPLFIKLLGWA